MTLVHLNTVVRPVYSGHLKWEKRCAVWEGFIDRPLTILAPGFGASAVAGSVLTVDPDVVVSGAAPQSCP